MKDGYEDKIKQLLKDAAADGTYCVVVGMRVEALDQMHCDVCRLVAIQELTSSAALDMLNYYKKQVDARNASSH